MTDIMAAIGLKQLERYPGLLERRHQLIQRYDEALHPLGIRTLPHFTPDYTSSGHPVPDVDPRHRGKGAQ